MPGLIAAGEAPSPRACAKPCLTLQAELLLAGYRADLLEGDDGAAELVVTRWAQTRRFNDFAEARAWEDQVLGRERQTTQPAAQEVRLHRGAAHEADPAPF